MFANKRFLSILIALLLLAVALAGCAAAQPAQPTAAEPTAAPAEPTPEPTAEPTAAVEEALPYGLKAGKPFAGTKIVVLAPNATQYNAVQAHTSEFTELTGIEVEYQFIPFGSLQEKITAEGVAGSSAIDVFNYLDTWGPAYKHFLKPLNDLLAEAGIDMATIYPPAFIAGATYDGVTYGLPMRGHPQLLFYRKDIFDELGLEPPTTWAELEEVSKTIVDKTDLYGMSVAYGKGTSLQNLFVWLDYLWSNGGDLFDADWRPVFNNEAGVKATERYINLLREGLAPPGSVVYNEYDSVTSVAQAESAMVISWWWQYTNLINPERAKPEVIEGAAFAPVPAWEGKEGATYAISLPLAINQNSKNQEAAWEWLKWVTNPDLAEAIAVDKSKPETTNNVVVRLDNLADPEINAAWNGMHQFALESLAVSDIMPQLPEWPEVSGVLEVAINDIATGADVQTTLDKAAAEITQIMERAGYY